MQFVLILVALVSLTALLTLMFFLGIELRRRKRKPASTARLQSHDDPSNEITVVGYSPMSAKDVDPDKGPPAEIEQSKEFGETNEITFDSPLDVGDLGAEVVLLTAVGQTHPGRRRPNNEDACLVAEEHRVFVVADGMGGYAGGEVASKIAVETILEAFDNERFTGSFDRNLPIHGAQLVAAIQMANRRIWKKAESDSELDGMGTTLVSLRFTPSLDRVYAGHVGDSRLYRLRDRQLEQVSTDHTLGNMGINGPMSHQLTRALGIAPGVEVDLITANCHAGDAFLLCSDGLNKMLNDTEINQVLNAASTPELAVETLISRANFAGGRDNITAILVQVREGPTSQYEASEQPTEVDKTDPGQAEQSTDVQTEET